MSLRSMRATKPLSRERRATAGRATHQPAAVGNDRRPRSLVSGLLFTMDGATPTCRAVSVCSAAHRWAVSNRARIEVMAGGTRGGRGPRSLSSVNLTMARLSRRSDNARPARSSTPRGHDRGRTMGIGRSRVIGACLSALAAMLALLASPGTASAQNWPTRPLTLVVPFAAGGPSDAAGRILAQGLSDVLGQQVVVENPSGAGGTVGSLRVAKAAPRGV